MNDKINALEEQIVQLEQAHAELVSALQTLLPLSLAVAATTSDSAQACKQLTQALQDAAMHPRSDMFWQLASAMSLMLSSKAVEQHPGDQDVLAIYQGLRDHKRH